MRFASSGFADALRYRRAAVLLAGSLALATGLLALNAPAACGSTRDAAEASRLETDPADWSRALRGISLPAGTRWVQGPEGVDPDAAEDALRRAGFVPAVVIPPSQYVVRAAPRSGALPTGFVERSAGGASPAVPAPRPAAIGAAIDGVAGADPFGGMVDVLPPVRAAREGGTPRARTFSDGALPTGLFYGTRWEDLAEFMVGRVAIGILFPESDGTVDPNLYDWSPALRDSVVRSAVRGFLKWSEEAALRGVPLSFHLEIHPSIPTRYEPISRPVSQEDIWIEDVLRQLVGYRGDATSMGVEFANGLRGRLGTHWAGLAIAVQNDSSSVGTFPDGLIAHARLGGPWFVIPVNNLRTTSATLDFYMEHELTHLFWALDEFPAVNAWWSCTLTTGYFNRPNLNSSIPVPGYCGVSENCVMRGNYPDAFCLPTREQVGWVDLDQNATLDLFETVPAVLPESTSYRAAVGTPLLLRGKASETAWPNRNPYRFFSGDSVSVSVIDSMFYRVDGGAWISMPPLDGVFDEGVEEFELMLDPLPLGAHTIEWDARNRNGKSPLTLASTTVTISGSSGSVDRAESPPTALRLDVGPVPARTSVRFTLQGGGGDRALVRIWTAAGSLARTWVVAASGPSTWVWDGRLRNGTEAPNGVYFVTVDAGGERVRRRLVWVR